MRNQILLIAALVSTTILFCHYQIAETILPQQHISLAYKKNLSEFVASINVMKTIAKDFSGTSKELEILKTEFFKSRYKYKKIECFSAYLDDYSTGQLNGANLPKIEYEQNEPSSKTEATGYQTLEELIFSDSMPNKTELIKILSGFDHGIRTLQSKTGQVKLEDAVIFDAFRHQVLRILSLGLSGYDSPVAFNSINEAIASLEVIAYYYSFYESSFDTKTLKVYASTNRHILLAIDYLKKNKDFEKFNRVLYTRNFLNPLFYSFAQNLSALKITAIDKNYPSQTPLSSEAQNLFSQNLIKPNFFHPDQIATPKKGLLALGQMLFFDPIISHNNKRSCASCHQPEKAFTDGQALATGFDFKGRLARNTPTLLNAGFQQKFQLDARAFHLEDQFAHVAFSATEMGGSATELQERMNKSTAYKKLFKDAFALTDQQNITHDLVFSALAVYVRSLNTFNTPFDKYMRNEVKAIQPQVIKGFNLFMGKAKCGTCHFTPLFNGTIPPDFNNTETEVLGVTKTNDFLHPILDDDIGRFAIADIDEHKHSFKTPTLRNIALTAPYMHNGAYKTLEEVMDFYNKGGGAGMGLDVPYQTLPSDKLNLTKTEISDIISFMKALSDTTGTQNRPSKLPILDDTNFNTRKIGGDY